MTSHPKVEGMWVGRFEIKWSDRHGVFQALDGSGKVHFEDSIGKKVHDWALSQIEKEDQSDDKSDNGSS